jgi:hypothetical protein
MLGILRDAGWQTPTFTRHELAFYVGGPGCSPEDATAIGLSLGPLSVLLRDAPAGVRAAAAAAVAADLADCVDDVGIRLQGGIAIVTADAPSP